MAKRKRKHILHIRSDIDERATERSIETDSGISIHEQRNPLALDDDPDLLAYNREYEDEW